MLQTKQVPLDILSIILYFLSLIFPVFYTKLTPLMYYSEPGPTWYGIETLLVGWMAAIFNPFRHFENWSIAWLANPLFFTTFILVKNKRPLSFPIALLTLIIALTSLYFREIWSDKKPPSVVVTSYGIGFYFWIIAFILITISAFKIFRKK